MSSQTVSEIQQLLNDKQGLKETSDLFNDVDLPAHPNVLGLELSETEDYLAQLYSKLIFSQTVNSLRKDIVQNKYDDIDSQELDNASVNKTNQQSIVNGLKGELEQLQNNIYSLIESLETDKSIIKTAQEEASERIADIVKMQSKIGEIDQLVSHKLEYTADEAKVLIDKLLTVEMPEVMTDNETKRYSCSEKSTKVRELEVEVAKLMAKRDVYAEDAQVASNSFQVADKSTNEKYQGYKKYTDLMCHIAGVEEVITESNGNLKMVYALPYNTELIISVNEEKSKVINAKTIGTVVPIEDVVELAKDINLYTGMDMIVRETLFRLKNRIQI